MDHVVYVDAKENELGLLLSGEKSMIVRGAAGRKLPHGRVAPGDCLYFVQNNGDGLARASAVVITVFNSEKLSEEESRRVIEENQPALRLTPAQQKRWAGKRYLVLIGISAASAIAPFMIDRSEYGSMDDWLPVGKIDSVCKPAGEKAA